MGVRPRDPGKGKRTSIPTLRHEEAVQYLVDYHFGRLSPSLTKAVEAHVRSCRACQRQGLDHAPTERRVNLRRLRRVRSHKRRISKRGRNVIIFLSLVALLQFAVVKLVLRPGASILSVLPVGGAHSSAAPSPTPTPVLLAPRQSFDVTTSQTVALGLSPNGATLATTSAHGGTPSITLWNVATGQRQAMLSWPGTAAPGALAWSPDGHKLVAADGSVIAAWALPSTSPLWTLNLPSGPALRVYDTQAATIVARPDPAAAFAHGTFLLWGANGQLSSAPVGAAGPTGVVAPGTPLVGLWQTNGSHLFAGASGSVYVGISSSDVTHHAALLSWSPDGRYVLWGDINQRVALPSGASTPSATPTAQGVPPPNAIVGLAADDVAHAGADADALVWFSPDGRLLIVCDRASGAAPLEVYDLSASRVVATLPDACSGLTLTSVAWTPATSAFLLARPGQPVGEYALPPISQ
jgi:hypothetical protein